MDCIPLGGGTDSWGGDCMSLEQNSMVQTYLDAVCSQIKWHEVHGQVKSELVSHLEEIALELKSDGMSDQDEFGQS